MAENLLQIIVSADLEDNAITNIKQKIDKLIRDYNEKEINLKLNMNDLDDADRINQVLASLSAEIEKVANKQEQALKNQNKSAKDYVGTIKQVNKNQLEGLKETISGYEGLDKATSKVNANGKTTLKTVKKYNDFIKQITTQTENGLAFQTDIDQGKFNKFKNGLNETYENIKKMGREGENVDKMLVQWSGRFKKLNVDSKVLTDDRLKEIVKGQDQLEDKYKAISKIEDERAKAQKLLEEYRKKEIKDVTKIKNLEKAIEEADKNFSDLEKNKKIYQDNIEYLQEAKRRTDALKESVEQLKATEKNERNARKHGQAVKSDAVPIGDRLNEIGKEGDLEKQRQQVKKFVAEVLKAERGLHTLTEEMVELKPVLDENGRVMYRAITRYESADKELTEYIHTVDLANRQFSLFNDTIRRTGESRLDTLSNAMRRIPIYLTAFSGFYGAIDAVRTGFESIYEIDKAMINLGKVTEASDTRLKAFMQTANEMGQELGMLTKDVIDATTEFQRLGYNLDASTGLAEQALIYANVGDMEVVQASQNLLSALRGFGVGQQEVVAQSQKYVDIFNEVGNNYAISSAGIGEALKRSSAILNVAGNSVEQSVGLIVSANASIQDPKKVGNALKTISMRLQGVEEDGSNIIGLVPELKGMFEDIGIDIMKTENEMYNTFEIFDKLSDKWNDIDPMKQGQIVEALGGKHQGAIVSAMLENWTDAQGAMETALTSAGSANREFEKYQEGMEYRVGQLQNSMEAFWMAFWNEDSLKTAISGLNQLVQAMTVLVDKVGALAPIAGVAVGAFLLLNREMRALLVGSAVITGGRMATQFSHLGTVFATMGKTLLNFLKGLVRAIPIIGGIMIVTAILEKIIEKTVEATKAREKYVETLQKEIDTNRQYLEDIKKIDFDRYSELEGKASSGTLSMDEYNEYASLQEQIKNNHPQLIAGYDEQGNAILKNAETIEKYNENMRNKIALDARNLELRMKEGVNEKSWFGLGESTEENITKTREEIVKTQEAYNEAMHDMEQNKMMISEFLFSGDAKKKFQEDKDAFVDAVWDLDEQLNWVAEHFGDVGDKAKVGHDALLSSLRSGDIDEAEKRYQELISVYEEQGIKLETELANMRNDFKEHSDYFQEMLQNEMIQITNSADFDTATMPFVQQLQSSFVDGFENTEMSMGAYADLFTEMFNKIKTEAEGADLDFSEMWKVENSDATISFLEDLVKNAKLSKDEVNALIRVIQNLRMVAEGSNVEEVFSLDKWKQKNFDIFDTYIDQVGELAEVQDQLNQGEELTLSQISGLIQKYPELSHHLSVQNGLLKIQASGIELVRKARQDSALEELTTQRELVNTQAEATRRKLNNYKKEIEAIRLANQALAKYDAEIAKRNANLSEGDHAYKRSGLRYKEMPTEFRGETLEDSYKTQLKNYESELAGIDALINAVQNGVANNFKTNKKAKEEAKETVYIQNKYWDNLRRINILIEDQNRLQDMYAKGSKKYQESLLKEINLLKDKRKWLKAERDEFDRQIKTGNYVTYGEVNKEDAVSPTGGGVSPSTTTAKKAQTTADNVWSYYRSIGRVSSQMGYRTHPVTGKRGSYHKGLDIAMSAGTDIKAVEGGKVIRKGYQAGGAGNYVVVGDGKGREEKYFHMLRDAIVNVGDTIAVGQKIGEVGSTGSSTGNHLHLEMYKSGKLVDPYQYFKNASGKVANSISEATSTYTVQWGDTLSEIAQKFGTTTSNLVKLNNLKSANKIYKGQVLKVSGATSQAVQTASNNITSYTVQYGDTLGEIARKFGTTTSKLASLNNISNPNKIFKGQVLKIQGATNTAVQTYVIKAGDTLSAIAQKFGVTVNELVNWNNIKDKNKISIGQKLTIGKATQGGGTTGGGTTTTGGGGRGDNTTTSEAERRTKEAFDQAQANLDENARFIQEMWRDYIVGFTGEFDESIKRFTDDVQRANWEVERATTTEDKSAFLDQAYGFIEDQAKWNAESIEVLWERLRENEGELEQGTYNQILDEIRARKTQQINYEQELYNTAKRIIDERVRGFETDVHSQFSQLEVYIEDIQRRIDATDIEENPKQYIALLREQMAIQEQQKGIVSDQIKDLFAMRKQYEGQAEIVEYIDTLIQEYEGNFKDLGDSIFDTTQEIKQAYESVADESIDLFKEAIQKRQEAEIDAINEVTSKREEAHDEYMSQLDEEANQLDKMYNEQLESIDKAEAERSYQHELGSLQEQRKAIADQIGLYAIDTTIEGKATKRALEEELRQVDEQIDEHKHQRRLDLQRQAIEDEREERLGAIDSRRTEAEDELEEFRNEQNQRIEDKEKEFKELLDDEQMFADLRKQIIEGNMEEISTIFDNYVDIIGEHSKELGDNFTENFVKKLRDAKKELQDFSEVYAPLKDATQIGIGENAFQNNPLASRLKDVLDINKSNIDPSTLSANLKQWLEESSKLTTEPMFKFMPVEGSLGNTIHLAFNIDRVENGIETANSLYKTFTDNLRRKGVILS